MALEALFPFLMVVFFVFLAVGFQVQPPQMEPFFKPLLAFMTFFTYSLVLSAIFVFTQVKLLVNC